jgi:hypothetical protein
MEILVAAVLLLLVAVVLAPSTQIPTQFIGQGPAFQPSPGMQSSGNGAAAFVAALGVLLVLVAMFLQVIH